MQEDKSETELEKRIIYRSRFWVCMISFDTRNERRLFYALNEYTCLLVFYIYIHVLVHFICTMYVGYVCMLVKQGVCVCFCFYYKGNAQTGPHNIHVCVHAI